MEQNVVRGWDALWRESHGSGNYQWNGHGVAWEIPWSDVDPFGDGFKRFDLSVETWGPNVTNSEAFASLGVQYADGSEGWIDGNVGKPGNRCTCSFTLESKTPKLLWFGYTVKENDYWGRKDRWKYNKSYCKSIGSQNLYKS